MSIAPIFRSGAGLALLLGACLAHAAVPGTMRYRSIDVDGVKVAYREAGRPDRPTVLLLHGVPSSSRMYDQLMRRLADEYHLVAPDYPGFGNSGTPEPRRYAYTFENLARTTQKFADALGLRHYVLLMQDYGAPVGMRMAMARPQAVGAMVFQNGNVYEEGLGPMWARRKPFWADRAAHEAEVVAAHQSLAVTRARHIGGDPDVEAYDPDLWMDEVAYLNRPGQARIQADLIHDYQHNLLAYPRWQAWLRQAQLPTLVVWGRHDPAFIEAGAHAFRRDLPAAQVHVLDGGHFVMDTRLDEMVDLTRAFLHGLDAGASKRP